MGLADTIRKARRTKRMSQRELGSALGVSGQAVHQWEQGDTEPSIDSRVMLAQVLDIPIAELLPLDARNAPAAEGAQEVILLERFRLLPPQFREAILRILLAQLEMTRTLR